jgi:hypothetical protein
VRGLYRVTCSHRQSLGRAIRANHPSVSRGHRILEVHSHRPLASLVLPVEGGGESLLEKLSLGALLHKLGRLARLVHLVVCVAIGSSVAKPSLSLARSMSLSRAPLARARVGGMSRRTNDENKFIASSRVSLRRTFLRRRHREWSRVAQRRIVPPTTGARRGRAGGASPHDRPVATGRWWCRGRVCFVCLSPVVCVIRRPSVCGMGGCTRGAHQLDVCGGK